MVPLASGSVNLQCTLPFAEGAMTVCEMLGTDFDSFGNLTYTFMTKYNSETPNNPNVKYFSWAGEVTVPAGIHASVTFPLCFLNSTYLTGEQTGVSS